MKSKLALLSILTLAFFIRTVFLKEVPPGIANDEINIIINAQSLLYTGENVPGVVSGILGKVSGNLGGGIHSELSSYYIIPFLALFGFSWPIVKLPFILASLGIVWVSYLLVKRLINHEAGLIAAFLASVNPWSIFFARSGYESIFSAFFYLLALYVTFSFKGWKILWSLPLFLLGLLSYFSAKTLMLPIAIVALFGTKFLSPKDSFKPVLVVNLLLILFLVIYLPLLSRSPAGERFNELQDRNIQNTVIAKRTQSLDSPLSILYENKYTEELKHRAHAAMGVFSPNFLFLDGQPESIPSLAIPDHSPLYLIDLPLIILGLFFLARNNRSLLFTLLGFILVTMIPNFLNLQGTTYMIRTVILFPLLTLISALGIYYLKNNFNLRFNPTYFLLFAFYMLFVGNFTFQYFTRLPIDKNEGWFLNDRIVAKYIKSSFENSTTSITLVSASPKQTAYRLLLFNEAPQLYNRGIFSFIPNRALRFFGMENRRFIHGMTPVDFAIRYKLYNDAESIKTINEKFAREDYSIGNLKITGDCPEPSKKTNLIVDTRIPCANDLKGIAIASLKDGRAQYVINNDQLCRDFIVRHYPLIKDINYLDIENLSNQDLCENFLTDIKLL